MTQSTPHSPAEPLNEQLSAFIDGELPEREFDLLFKRLEREPELRMTVGRYAAIGESLRAGTHRGVSRGFASRVSEAVARESIPPRAAALGKVGGFQVRWLRKAGRMAAGAAIAATVAGFAIFILQQQAIAPGASQASLQANTTAAGTVIIGNSEAPSYTVTLPATTGPMVPAARLTDYVIAHSEYSSPLVRRSMLSGAIAEDPTPVESAETVAAAVVKP